MAKLHISVCVKEAEREVALRENVYPKWVDSGRMTQFQADGQLKAMRQILAILKWNESQEDEIKLALAVLKLIRAHKGGWNFLLTDDQCQAVLNQFPDAMVTKIRDLDGWETPNE